METSDWRLWFRPANSDSRAPGFALISLRMADDNQDPAALVALYTQMFALAGAMVGVCLTVIGVLRLLTEIKGYRTLGDDLVAVDGLIRSEEHTSELQSPYV